MQMAIRFRVDIPTHDQRKGAIGWQAVVVNADDTGEARVLALAEALTPAALRHRRGARLQLISNDPNRQIQVHDLTSL